MAFRIVLEGRLNTDPYTARVSLGEFAHIRRFEVDVFEIGKGSVELHLLTRLSSAALRTFSETGVSQLSRMIRMKSSTRGQ